MTRPKGLVLSGLIATAALLLAAGCSSGGRQASPSASRPAAEQPGAPAAPSAPPSGGAQPEAASTPAASSQTQASAPKVKACDLLTKEEVADVLGRPIISAQLTVDTPDQSQCFYEYKPDIGIFINYGNMLDYFKLAVKEEAVPGLGDEAYWNGDLLVRVNDRVLWIMMSVGTGDINGDLKSIAVSLAKKAVGRMRP